MYYCVRLSKQNFDIFKKLNKSNKNFNVLNKNFFETYNKSNFATQIMLKRKVRLLRKDFEYIGYVWFDMKDKNNCSINSLNIPKSSSYLPYKILVDTLRNNCNISYLCEDNQYNFEILKNIGFQRKDGTLMLSYDIKDHMPLIQQDGLEFEIFKIGTDEKRRCDIQNEVFKDNVRAPLTLDDIYFDEIQNYYVHKGSVFLKKHGEYIGYGQIIIEDNMPLIVNFGILKEYRGNGYSKSLISYLLNIVKYNNFDEVKIKVKASNIIALNLYKNLGFRTISQRYKWELKK